MGLQNGMGRVKFYLYKREGGGGGGVAMLTGGGGGGGERGWHKMVYPFTLS